MKTKPTDKSVTEIFGEVISSYTRKQAIEDGVLIDITELAKEQGFKYPVAITTAVFEIVNDAVEKDGKDYNGVIWDTLTMLRHAIKLTAVPGGELLFRVLIWSKYTTKDEQVKLKSVCSGGDNHEPVITIMLPNED